MPLRQRWSSERVSLLAGITAGLSLAIAILVIDARVGTEPMALPRGYHAALCDEPILTYPSVPLPRACSRLVRAL